MKKNQVLQRIRQRIPLRTKLRVALQVYDYEHWDNGRYFGDADKYTDVVLGEVRKHMKRHLPDVDVDQLKLD